MGVQNKVASFTDAWIETLNNQQKESEKMVASFTDAWIETDNDFVLDAAKEVASFTDAWIETTQNNSLHTSYCRIFYRCVD